MTKLLQIICMGSFLSVLMTSDSPANISLDPKRSTISKKLLAQQPVSVISLDPEQSTISKKLLAQQPASVEVILLELPRPKGSPTNLSTISSPDAYQKKSLSFQADILLQPSLNFYRKTLKSLGYKERTNNSLNLDWGFSLIFDLPKELIFPSQDSRKKVVLVVQGTKHSFNAVYQGKDHSTTTTDLSLRFVEY